MRPNALITAVGLALLIAGAVPAAAQTMTTAEVRTWTGQTYLLTEPSLEVRYTIMVPTNEGPGPSETAPTTGPRAPMLFGSAGTISQFLDKQPDPLQGHRQSDTITLRKGGTEVRLPLANVGALFFTRQPTRSPLPSYAAGHYRYAATAVLADGSRIEGDDVSLGTTFLRGRTALGTVDVPWHHIETVLFKR
jgi:hypothetical protein